MEIPFRWEKMDESCRLLIILTTHLSKAFLDPSFWQSLGKALDRRTLFVVLTTLDIATRRGKSGYMIAWRRYWHRFIDHLADGKGVDEFFEQLS